MFLLRHHVSLEEIFSCVWCWGRTIRNTVLHFPSRRPLPFLFLSFDSTQSRHVTRDSSLSGGSQFLLLFDFYARTWCRYRIATHLTFTSCLLARTWTTLVVVPYSFACRLLTAFQCFHHAGRGRDPLSSFSLFIVQARLYIQRHSIDTNNNVQIKKSSFSFWRLGKKNDDDDDRTKLPIQLGSAGSHFPNLLSRLLLFPIFNF